MNPQSSQTRRGFVSPGGIRVCMGPAGFEELCAAVALDADNSDMNTRVVNDVEGTNPLTPRFSEKVVLRMRCGIADILLARAPRDRFENAVILSSAGNR